MLSPVVDRKSISIVMPSGQNNYDIEIYQEKGDSRVEKRNRVAQFLCG
jgi:hypothetical protein